MSAVADKLDEARALIERGWTQNAFARGRTGRRVQECGRAAVCWCAYGALSVVRGQGRGADLLRKAIGLKSIVAFNDAAERTQAEVIEAFRKAAELARAASVDTLPDGRDAKQGSVRSKGSAVPSEASADAQPQSNDSERQS